MMNADAAHSFMSDHARPVEQAVHAVLFAGGDPVAVVEALLPYRNDDGGFGHGLEPDKLVPDSQALDVEVAFERLATAGALAPELLAPACDWLATIADGSGAVPVLMANSNDHPRAGHWNAPSYPPGLNPTAAIAGHAHAIGVKHRWLDLATDYCFAEIEAGNVANEGHELLAVTKFLDSAPDRDRVAAVAPLIAAAIESASFMKYDPASDAYGVTPIDFAPLPNSLAASWFPEAIIEGHLTALAAQQEDDGGWPIAWEPPTPDSLRAWRGIRTLAALRTLTAYLAHGSHL